MAVGFSVDFDWFQIGNGDFLYSFFSTVAYHLENENWGSRFPLVMNELYQGKLEAGDVDGAIREVLKIQLELKGYLPNQVIWDIDNLSAKPPWGDNISEEITDLSNYFVTSGGEDFFSVFLEALEDAKELGVSIKIEAV
ncbi:MAG: hypothetical protein HFH69_04860 [Lachnospiraceae bacterium]|nr:hypothetical protein [Lachnospiraceae bacterium]